MKIRLAQMQVVAGNPSENFDTCQKLVENAKNEGFDIIVFPGMCISGLMVGNKFDEPDFIDDCELFEKKLTKLSSNDFAIIFNSIKQIESNCFEKYTFVAKGSSIDCIRENPYQTYLIDLNGFNLGISTIDKEIYESNYNINESQYESYSANLIINVASSPFYLGKNACRNHFFSTYAICNKTAVINIDNVGLQNKGKTIFAFDGSTAIWNAKGELIAQTPMYQTCNLDLEYVDGNIKILSNNASQKNRTDIEEIYETVKNAIRYNMQQLGLQRVVIGASGGIDSAVAAAMYVEAIGAKNVTLVNMPTRFNSQTTIGLAKQLAANLGCYYCSVPIEDSVKLTSSQINGLEAYSKDGDSIKFELSQFNLENVQARDRSSRILAAIASAWGAVFTNNGNKTETTIGYATLYGDVAGFFSILADLWKFQVYALGRYVNSISTTGEKIPASIFEIVPSAELSAAQSLDAGKGDPVIYPYHDRLFASWQEWDEHAGLSDILLHYINDDLADFLNRGEKSELTEELIKRNFPTANVFVKDLERWWRLFKGMAVSKRLQAPPILAISKRPYGTEYQESVCKVFYSQRYLELKKKLNIE